MPVCDGPLVLSNGVKGPSATSGRGPLLRRTESRGLGELSLSLYTVYSLRNHRLQCVQLNAQCSGSKPWLMHTEALFLPESHVAGNFQTLGSMIQLNVGESKRDAQTVAQKQARTFFAKNAEVCLSCALVCVFVRVSCMCLCREEVNVYVLVPGGSELPSCWSGDRPDSQYVKFHIYLLYIYIHTHTHSFFRFFIIFIMYSGGRQDS